MPEVSGQNLILLADAEMEAWGHDAFVVAAATEEHGQEAAGEHAAEAVGQGEHAVVDGAHAAMDAHGGSGHGGRPVTHPPELPHFVKMTFDVTHGHDYGTVQEAEDGELSFLQILHVGPLSKPVPFVDHAPWENNLFTGIGAIALVCLTLIATRPFRTRSREDMLRNPTRLQVAMEGLVSATDEFVKGILGEENGRRYLPFVSTLFFLILTLNLMGIVPFMKAPTSSLLITGSLALMTFIYYFYVALTRLGPVELFKHLCGSPTSLIQWFLAPLMLIIECISFFIAKPLSLALRLFGNILGKDILLGVMLGLGLMISGGMLNGIGGFIGLPLTFPFYFLALLLSTIQALVFALLSAIYILMVLPHDHDHDAEGHH